MINFEFTRVEILSTESPGGFLFHRFHFAGWVKPIPFDFED